MGHLYLLMSSLIASSSLRKKVAGSSLRDFYVRESLSFIEQHYRINKSCELMKITDRTINEISFMAVYLQAGVKWQKTRCNIPILPSSKTMVPVYKAFPPNLTVNRNHAHRFYSESRYIIPFYAKIPFLAKG
jgi:hypothetical protein